MLVIPGRPASDGLVWWMMTAPDAAPDVTLLDAADGEAVHVHLLDQIRGTDSEQSGDVHLVAATGLRPDRTYRMRAVAGGERGASRSRTLPARMDAGAPFTVALGSCYSFPTHRGVGWWYPPEKHKKLPDPVRLRFLCGDQIYMDLAQSDGHVERFRPRPFEKYARQWLSPHFRPFMRSSPNLMLADDHEYWNNYPHKPAWLSWAEERPGGPVGRSMDRAFSTFQAALNIDPHALAGAGGNGAAVRRILGDGARTFGFDVDPISFFLLDTRSQRTRHDADEPHFSKPSWLKRATAWLAGLKGPGVLVMAQTLVEEPAGPISFDAGLPDYAHDFRVLCDAIFDAPHDVVVLCGDIHWSRHRTLTRQDGQGPTVHEIVSSPLSRIPKLPFEDLLNTYPGDDSGVFTWGGAHAADWKLGTFRTGEGATYATLQFTVDQAGAVSVRAEAWGNQVPSKRARSLAHERFALR